MTGLYTQIWMNKFDLARSICDLCTTIKTASNDRDNWNWKKSISDFFKYDIEGLKKDKNQNVVELLIETNGEDLIHPFNLVRLDFIYKDGKNEDKIISLELDLYQYYETITRTINNTKIEIFPFCWNNCKFITGKNWGEYFNPMDREMDRHWRYSAFGL